MCSPGSHSQLVSCSVVITSTLFASGISAVGPCIVGISNS